MKKKNLWIIALVAIITIGIIACKEDDPDPIEQPKVQPDTQRTLSFGTDCKVTIKSDDTFLTAEWTTLCNSVVAAIKNEYDRGNNAFNKGYFELEFASAKNTAVKILPNTATYKCEVKVGDQTIYLRLDAISTADLQAAVLALNGGSTNQQS